MKRINLLKVLGISLIKDTTCKFLPVSSSLISIKFMSNFNKGVMNLMNNDVDLNEKEKIDVKNIEIEE